MLTSHQPYAMLREILPTQRTLTTDQAAALRAELDTDPTRRGYKDGDALKAPDDLLPLLNDVYGEDNPESQGRVPVIRITPAEWGAFASRMLGKLRGANMALMRQGQPPSPAVLTLIDIINEQSALVQYTGYVEVQGSAWVSLRPVAVQLGATDDTEVDELTSIPDPAYQPTLTMPSRASVLFGDGKVLERGDLLSVMEQA